MTREASRRRRSPQRPSQRPPRCQRRHRRRRRGRDAPPSARVARDTPGEDGDGRVAIGSFNDTFLAAHASRRARAVRPDKDDPNRARITRASPRASFPRGGAVRWLGAALWTWTVAVAALARRPAPASFVALPPAPSSCAAVAARGRRRPLLSPATSLSAATPQPSPSTARRARETVKFESRGGEAGREGDDDDAEAAVLRTLASFASNLGRHRAARRRAAERGDSTAAHDDALIGAGTALVHFLRRAPNPGIGLTGDRRAARADALEAALVPALRGAGNAGDHVLPRRLAEAAVAHAAAAAHASSAGGPGLLAPRVLGEAVAALGRTPASASKVKALWSYLVHDVALGGAGGGVLTAPPAARELNAALSALRDRGKTNAALRLYRQHAAPDAADTPGEQGVVAIEGDAYTASILFGALGDALARDAGGSRRRRRGGGGGGPSPAATAADGRDAVPPSPFWQWNEAVALLDTLPAGRLNNHAYTALLRVNERATEQDRALCSGGGARHDGARCAMFVLGRMKVRLRSWSSRAEQRSRDFAGGGVDCSNREWR